MGEIRVRLRLENEGDLYMCEQRKLSRKKIRKAEAEVAVDTGAVMVLSPQEMEEQLGLSRLGRVICASLTTKGSNWKRPGAAS